jgi:hypothetical protein
MEYEVGLGYGEAGVEFWGGYGVEGALRRSAEGGYEGQLKAEGLPVVIGDGVVYGDVEAKGRYEGGKLWVEGKRLSLRYEGQGEYPGLRAEGIRYGEGDVHVDRLWVDGAEYGVTGSLDGRFGGELKGLGEAAVLGDSENFGTGGSEAAGGYLGTADSAEGLGSAEGSESSSGTEGFFEARVLESIPGFELRSRFIGDGYLGNGESSYEVLLRQDGGRVVVDIGVDRYELGAAGFAGVEVGGRLKAEGLLNVESLGRLVKGDVGVVAGWEIGAEAKAWAEGWLVKPQTVALSISATAIEGRVSGTGYEGVVRYGYERKGLAGELKVERLRPSSVVDLGQGIAKELAALEYEGEVRGSYEAGRLSYEGALRVKGGDGLTVGG